MDNYSVYKEMVKRTNGEVYIGVTGPVRTGKSTFIKRFIEQLVLPNMEDGIDKERVMDELPQSSNGTMIMTTEPKFIPKDAAKITINEDIELKVRLSDCVGYMVDGAIGHLEEGKDRMIKTPWFDEEIPFSLAAKIGTEKVIKDHSSIGVLVTTDGSIGDLDREAYINAEENCVNEMKNQGKPFLILLNSKHPMYEDTVSLAHVMQDKYGVYVYPVNVDQLKKDDICEILEAIMFEFPIDCVYFHLPGWFKAIDQKHELKQTIIQLIKKYMLSISKIRDIYVKDIDECEYIKKVQIEKLLLDKGILHLSIILDDKYFYEMLSQWFKQPIHSEYAYMKLMKEISSEYKQYETINHAIDKVKEIGYGAINPSIDEITFTGPELIHHGNKYGLKLCASAPSYHLIKANITTEIAPIVGNKDQAEDLIAYIEDASKNSLEELYDVSIFGKSLKELIEEGMEQKITSLTDQSQMKLQETMEKIVNESNGGMVFIII